MNRMVNEFVALVRDNATIATKSEMISLVTAAFDMVKDGRSLYHTDYFAVVFCYTKNAAFSNVVISLSKLEKYDGIPCFVVVVRRDLDNVVYMINSTFIDKVSHSSQSLRLDNIRGSILGSNIRKQLPEIGRVNAPDDFEELFAYHKGFAWTENLERIVERTNHIRPVKVKVALSPVEYSNPKAYNVDKFLKCMGEDRSVFMFFFVGIDDSGIVNTVLCSVFHDQLMKTTILQHHWAGRATRGVAQFNGKAINEILSEPDFRNNIDEESARSYLENLLNR